VVGEHGTAKWNGHEEVNAEIVTATAGFHSEFESFSSEPFNVKAGIAGSLEDFLNALKTGQSPRGECHDNILSLAMVFGAIESAKRGCRVTIDEMLSLS
jgi:predicted dehydrogenase